MWSIKKKIGVINQEKLSVSNVFNALFRCHGKLLYVENDVHGVVGVISITDFLSLYLSNNSVGYNDDFLFVQGELSKKAICEAASKICEEHHIRSSLPILLPDGSVTGEISEEPDTTIDAVIDNFKRRIYDYEHSRYLSGEVKALKKILSAQKVIILGGKEEFEKKLGVLFDDTSRLVFLDDIENPYDFFSGNHSLLIDVTDEYPLRAELYDRLDNGYAWSWFMDAVLQRIESGAFGNACRLENDDKCRGFENYLKKRITRMIYSYDRQPETEIILKYIKRAGISISLEEKCLKKRGESLIKYDVKGELREFYAPMYRILEEYLFEINAIEINHTYKNTILNYMIYRDIPLYENEKKSFESAEFFENVREKSVTALSPICRFIEGDACGFKDYIGEHITFENGLRKTVGQPEYYYRTIYCMGACTMFGAHVIDEYTIPSLLQKKLNNEGFLYRVVNLGMAIVANIYQLLNRVKVEDGDIILILHPFRIEELEENKISLIDISDKLEELHTSEFFLDEYTHCTADGSIAYAESIFPVLFKKLKNALRRDMLKKNNIFDIYRDMPFEYVYENKLNKMRKEMKTVSWVLRDSSRIGAIVMNANPFTNGHLYLVEEALKRVDYLYVFVVEEDKSEFSYKDRFYMVEAGLEHCRDRVKILPSGFIGSKVTFPAYFENEKNTTDANISTILDSVFFARYIAPAGNITVRFVGTEDGDKTTFQYNRDMKRVLPLFGIDVIEIERLRKKDMHEVRAGIIRDAYRRGAIDMVSDMLPLTTYYHLKNLLDKQCF